MLLTSGNLWRPSALPSTSLSRLNLGPGGLTLDKLTVFQDTQPLFREVIKCSVKVSCGRVVSVHKLHRVVGARRKQLKVLGPNEATCPRNL